MILKILLFDVAPAAFVAGVAALVYYLRSCNHLNPLCRDIERVLVPAQFVILMIAAFALGMTVSMIARRALPSGLRKSARPWFVRLALLLFIAGGVSFALVPGASTGWGPLVLIVVIGGLAALFGIWLLGFFVNGWGFRSMNP